jgi:hypothetical protein
MVSAAVAFPGIIKQIDLCVAILVRFSQPVMLRVTCCEYEVDAAVMHHLTIVPAAYHAYWQVGVAVCT